MCLTELAPSLEAEVAPATAAFYRRALRRLAGAGIPFLVGGAFAQACYTGIRRPTKDLDLFLRRADCERVAQLAAAEGWTTEFTHPHWLAKVYRGEDFIDLIFNSGNGLTPVEDGWFRDAPRACVLGVAVQVAPVEESLVSKSFIMERERYDGADVAHLLQAAAGALDWQRLLALYGPHWRVLLAHLVLFGFIYPGERHRIPAWVMAELLARLAAETREPPPLDARVCAGTLLSREQYLHDVERLGYLDGRLWPASSMTPEDVARWTRAIASRQDAAPAAPPS